MKRPSADQSDGNILLESRGPALTGCNNNSSAPAPEVSLRNIGTGICRLDLKTNSWPSGDTSGWAVVAASNVRGNASPVATSIDQMFADLVLPSGRVTSARRAP